MRKLLLKDSKAAKVLKAIPYHTKVKARDIAEKTGFTVMQVANIIRWSLAGVYVEVTRVKKDGACIGG